MCKKRDYEYETHWICQTDDDDGDSIKSEQWIIYLNVLKSQLPMIKLMVMIFYNSWWYRFHLLFKFNISSIVVCVIKIIGWNHLTWLIWWEPINLSKKITFRYWTKLRIRKYVRKIFKISFANFCNWWFNPQ